MHSECKGDTFCADQIHEDSHNSLNITIQSSWRKYIHTRLYLTVAENFAFSQSNYESCDNPNSLNTFLTVLNHQHSLIIHMHLKCRGAARAQLCAIRQVTRTTIQQPKIRSIAERLQDPDKKTRLGHLETSISPQPWHVERVQRRLF